MNRRVCVAACLALSVMMGVGSLRLRADPIQFRPAAPLAGGGMLGRSAGASGSTTSLVVRPGAISADQQQAVVAGMTHKLPGNVQLNDNGTLDLQHPFQPGLGYLVASSPIVANFGPKGSLVFGPSSNGSNSLNIWLTGTANASYVLVFTIMNWGGPLPFDVQAIGLKDTITVPGSIKSSESFTVGYTPEDPTAKEAGCITINEPDGQWTFVSCHISSTSTGN